VLAERASPTLAAAQATTVEQGAVAPTVVALADASTIAVDASLGNDFRVTLGGNRAMANPANPTDGQKIVFEVTQGSGGPYSLNWGTSYEFSAGLPQPTLSTGAGQTDLLGFVYNRAKGSWLLAAFVNGFASPPVAPPPPGAYRLFASVNGPAAATSYSGPFIAGVVFSVSTGGTWINGYWWWVCDSDQPTAPQKFALWQVYTDATGSLITTATATSGTLTAGQWNYVQLTSPVPLSIGATYVAATGFTGSFPATSSQFGAGQTYGAGIVSGPLIGYSDQGGSLPASFSVSQGSFSVAASDPTQVMPAYGYQSDNFWMDIQVGTSPPTGTSYRLWPNYPTIPGTVDTDTSAYTLATEFLLSATCALDTIWFYSPAGATALPSRCAIWNVSSQTVVAGTNNTSPSWTGAAGGGWVSCAYNGVTLPAGDYKVAVYYGGGSQWFQVNIGYFGSGGIAVGGITAGPLTAPGTSAATSPGQGTYNAGSWAYPQSYGTGGNGESYWVDVEVTPT
jgi:hypothetical protein